MTRRTAFDIDSVIRDDLRALPPYVPVLPTAVLAARLGIAPGDVLKLDGNENPYGPSPRVLEALGRYDGYAIYPDPDQTEVREALAEYAGVPAEHIVCGLGSDDLIDLVLRAVVEPGDGVIDCPPTFGMYPFSSRIAGARVLRVPRDEAFALDVSAVVAQASDAKIVFIASPNNPSGNLLPRKHLLRLLDLDLLVVFDEAYIEFAGREQSAASLVPDHENLVVLRTFSKWGGIAGLRAGYGIMAPKLASLLMTIKQPYNLNVAASLAMLASLEDRALLDERACKLAGSRAAMAAALAEIEWVTPYPSEANFLLCRLDGVDAREVRDRLAARGIFVRWFDAPELRDCLRISAGLPQHTDMVARAIREIGAELGR